MIALSSELSIDRSESLIASLRGKDRDLRVPLNSKGHQFGGMCSAIQALITWARSAQKPRLITSISGSTGADADIQDFVNKDHCLVAALLADDVLDRNGASIGAHVRARARERLLRLQQDVNGARRGAKLLFLALDGTPFAYPPLLYYQIAMPEVRSTSDFTELAFEMMRLTAEFGKSTRKRIVEDLSTSLGPILFELFQNTHLWARSEFGQTIRSSIRGIRIELQRDHRRTFETVVADCPSLLRYIRETDTSDERGLQSFIELSVFDGGLGLAQTWLNRRIDLDEDIGPEYAAVIDCLRLHATSSKELHRGIGLPRVMSLLTHLHGFLRIRTGRLGLFRDFRRDPYPAEGPDSETEPYLHDWPQGGSHVKALPRVEGTLLTMIFPVYPGA